MEVDRRTYLAGQALAGILASPHCVAPPAKEKLIKAMAQAVVRFADATLDELDRTRPEKTAQELAEELDLPL